MELAEYEVLLSDVEVKLDRLKVLYEQWFQGMERLEPSIPRKDMERRVLTLRKELPRNTALRFRFQQLVQRYTTLQTYWQRVARQIEEGTYRRDLLKARKQRIEMRQHTSLRPAARVIDLDIDVELGPPEPLDDGVVSFVPAHLRTPPPPAPSIPAPVVAIPAAPAVPAAPKMLSPFARPRPVGSVVAPLPSPSAPSHPPPAAKPVAQQAAPVAAAKAPATFARPKDTGARPPGAVPPEVEDRRVYERYLEARRANNETTSVTFETVSKSLRDMRERLKDKHAGKKVDFEVVVKDGKVGFKPVPK